MHHPSISSRRHWLACALVGAVSGTAALAPAAWAAQPAAASATTVAITHAKGTTQVPTAPQRVVVFDIASLDTMHTLGLPVVGVPKAQFPDYLKGYAGARYTVAGSLFEPDYDALSRIQPDLIIVGGRSAGKYELLSKIAPTVDLTVNSKQMLQDVARNVNALAGLYGKQSQGKALVEQINAEVAQLRQVAGKAQPGLLLMAVNEKIMPQAPGARFGFLFDVLGAPSAISAKDVPPRGTAYTFDDLAKLNPAWLYVIDRNTGTGSAAGGGAIIPSQQVFDNAQVKGTTAGQKGQVVFLDPKGWYLLGSTGPTALRGNVAQLQQAYTRAAAAR